LQGEFATATTADAKKQVTEKYFEALAGYAANLCNFAEANAGDKTADDARKEATSLIGALGNSTSPAIAKHLRALAEKSTDRQVQASAYMALAENLIGNYQVIYS